MKYNKLIYLSLILLLLSNLKCGSDNHKLRNIDNDLSNIKKEQSLLIIAEDRSGSTSSIRKLMKDDYSQIFKTFQNKYYGQIAIRVIGNPKPDEREFFMLPIKKVKEFVKVFDDDLLSKKGIKRSKNKLIEKENSKITEINIQKIDEFVNTKIEKHIINYKAYNGHDVTNIYDALEHIKNKINEPTFNNYKYIQVLIISDGKHDANKLKEQLSFKINKEIELFTIGWKNMSVFQNIINKSSFESVEGFIEYYKNN